MAGKHQIWSSNKKTRVRAGRKWRRQANGAIKAQGASWFPRRRKKPKIKVKQDRPLKQEGLFSMSSAFEKVNP